MREMPNAPDDDDAYDRLSPLVEGQTPVQMEGAYQVRLESNNICMLIPAGAIVDGGTMRLPGGILILGALRGKIICESGSAIIGSGGEFQGQIEADDVLIEGNVTSPVDSAGKPALQGMTEICARGQKNLATGEISGGVLMIGGTSTVCARMKARAYQIVRNANVSGSITDTFFEEQ